MPRENIILSTWINQHCKKLEHGSMYSEYKKSHKHKKTYHKRCCKHFDETYSKDSEMSPPMPTVAFLRNPFQLENNGQHQLKNFK